MKRKFFALLMLCTTILACNALSAPPTVDQSHGVQTIVAETIQAYTQAAPTPQVEQITSTSTPNGIPVSISFVNFVIPQGLGTGASAATIPEVTEESGAPWDVAPAYSEFTLQGYPLQGKFFEPKILIYPAAEFEAVSIGAAQSLASLRAIINGSTNPITKDSLPGVPTFNAGMVIASNIQVIGFQNGSGVRVLTEYAQYFAPINNHELMYQFQGLTNDGKYYVIAILPINASFLPIDENPDAVIPADGVPLPANGNPPDETYYAAITQKLEANSPDAFIPSLNALDALIQSITITSP